MKKEFPGYFANHVDDIEELWGECFFVLDANVLLSLYRYSDATRSELLQVFASLNDRLWIPHQVAQEYLVNRLAVIGEQAKAYDESVRKIDVIRKLFENSNYHPFVSAETMAECVGVFDKLVEELDANKSVHEARIGSDEIKDLLGELFEGKVGKRFDKNRLEQVIKDGAGRYEEKIPPGYRDIKKGGDSKVFADLCKPYGDYILWLQIIEQAKEVNRPVIFVTGDGKDDWWMTFQGRTIGPSPQLIEEFILETNNSFYMYSPDRFLERANSYLKQETSPEAMIEIQSFHDDESNESNFDAAVFDMAINTMWPAARPEPPEDSDSPWLGQGALTLSDVLVRRKALTDRAFELSKELIKIQIYYKDLTEPYEDGLLRPFETMSEKRLQVYNFKKLKYEERVAKLKNELDVLRAGISDLVGLQRVLEANQ